MSSMKATGFFRTLCAALLIGNSADATVSDNAQLVEFATCAGRLSAQMEYQWMFDGPLSEQTEIERAAMIDLVNAIMQPDEGRAVLHWRISAKQAQSALLTRATFNNDAADAAWAARMAAQLARECTALILH